MKDFFSKNGLWILFAAVVIAVGLSITTAVSSAHATQPTPTKNGKLEPLNSSAEPSMRRATCSELW